MKPTCKEAEKQEMEGVLWRPWRLTQGIPEASHTFLHAIPPHHPFPAVFHKATNLLWASSILYCFNCLPPREL